MPGATLIALMIEPRSWRNRQVIEGATAYFREHTDWRVVLQEVIAGDDIHEWAPQARPSGVIAEISSRSMARTLHAMGIPVVDILGQYPSPRILQVACDDRLIVQQAVDHLLAGGLRHVAFVGERGRRSAAQRRAWCEEHFLRPDGRPRSFDTSGEASYSAVMLPRAALLPDGLAGLAAWLRDLPKPVGVVACDDIWGAQILRACGDHGLHVPDDVAVIGADDDPVFCQMSDPLLSSIDCNAHAVGYEAAAILRGMVITGATPPTVTLIAPGSVQRRASTDVLAIPDQQVVAAVRFLRGNACAGLTPDSVAARLGISRRTLERMFDRYVGHSPATEMTRVRLDRARELLTGTSLSLAAIATRVGIANVETMHRLFKRRFGLTPGAYRCLNNTPRPTGRDIGRRRRP